MSDFSTRLKSCISDRSTCGFATECGVAEGTIRSLVLGNSMPRLDTLLRIADVAGVTVEWLSTGVGPKSYAESDFGKKAKQPKAAKRMTITTVIEWELDDE